MHKESPQPSYPDGKVRVSSPARLHLGFLDLNGQTGRKFGSIGLAIDSHHTSIEASLSGNGTPHVSAQTEQQVSKVQLYIDRFFEQFDQENRLPRAIKIDVTEAIPEHAGLGSGTQLALTVGTALSRLYNIPLSTQDIAKAMQRGKRSGIGIAAFDHGGFIIDGGLGPNSDIPPLLFHSPYPETWRIVLVMQTSRQGVHGQYEKQAFKELPRFPEQDAHTICHTTLMKLLPSLQERDSVLFGEAISEIQARIGNHFSPAQGGQYTSQRVASILEYARSSGHHGIAQSSWGPTGCIFVDSPLSADQLLNELHNYIDNEFTDNTDLSLLSVTANTRGAVIECDKLT